jgi:hypothetical protein
MGNENGLLLLVLMRLKFNMRDFDLANGCSLLTSVWQLINYGMTLFHCLVLTLLNVLGFVLH